VEVYSTYSLELGGDEWSISLNGCFISGEGKCDYGQGYKRDLETLCQYDGSKGLICLGQANSHFPNLVTKMDKLIS
jgi:hypothetical protein